MAAMGHPEVHRVRPQRRVVQGRGDGGVVKEGLLLHHGELIVPTDAQVRSPHADHAVVCQVGVFLSDDPHASHLFRPVVHGGVRPESFVVVVPGNRCYLFVKPNSSVARLPESRFKVKQGGRALIEREISLIAILFTYEIE